MSRYHTARLLIESAGDDEYEPWSFPWIRPEDAASGLAEHGEDGDVIHDLVSTEGRELAETLDSLPDPMEIWRTLSLPPDGPGEGPLGVYWSWSKAGAIAHIGVDGLTGITVGGLTGEVSLLHGEVEKRNVNWPRTFAANLSGYPEEAEVYLNAGTPVRLLDIDGDADGRTLIATRTGPHPLCRTHRAAV